MDRRSYLVLAGASLAGCLDSRAGAGSEYDVGMSTSAFRPREITVDVGTSVVWRNTSKQGHTVTAYEEQLPADASYFASGGFASEAAARDAWLEGGDGGIYQNEEFNHTFEVVGEYPYFCVPHERAGMVGTVVVE